MPSRKGEKKPVISFNSTSITEGDSLITTLINLKPRKKFFYALTGDGVDKSDLDSGKIKGRLKASKQGTAVLSHLFSEDNFNEGTETFTLSIFKDKKNRKLLGESQVVSVEDLMSTSYNNNSDEDSRTELNFKVNGFYPETVISDEVYGKDSSLIKGNKNLWGEDYLKKAVTFDIEVEFGEEFIVLTTNSIRKDSTTDTGRTVYQGEFKYDGDVITSARIDYIAQVSHGEEYGWGIINKEGKTVPHPDSASSWQSTFMTPGETLYEYDIDMYTPGEITGDYSTVTSFGMGRFFYDGWENNPFASDLI